MDGWLWSLHALQGLARDRKAICSLEGWLGKLWREEQFGKQLSAHQ